MGGRVCGECAAAGGCAWLCAASKHNGVYQLSGFGTLGTGMDTSCDNEPALQRTPRSEL